MNVCPKPITIEQSNHCTKYSITLHFAKFLYNRLKTELKFSFTKILILSRRYLASNLDTLCFLRMAQSQASFLLASLKVNTKNKTFSLNHRLNGKISHLNDHIVTKPQDHTQFCIFNSIIFTSSIRHLQFLSRHLYCQTGCVRNCSSTAIYKQTLVPSGLYNFERS